MSVLITETPTTVVVDDSTTVAVSEETVTVTAADGATRLTELLDVNALPTADRQFVRWDATAGRFVFDADVETTEGSQTKASAAQTAAEAYADTGDANTLAEAVILAPGSGRNTLQPTVDAASLILKAHAGGSATVLDWYDGAGSYVGSLGPAGLWLQEGAAQGAGIAWFGGGYQANPPTNADRVIESFVAANAGYSFRIQGDGTMLWGPGTGAQDTNLYRASAGILATDYRFRLHRTSTSDTALDISLGAETERRFAILGDGHIQWGDGTDAKDTFLYRSGASALAVGGSLEVLGSVASATQLIVKSAASQSGDLQQWQDPNGVQLAKINSAGGFSNILSTTASAALQTYVTADTTPRFQVNADGRLNWGPGNAAQDTNLYRYAPSVLKTDDALVVPSLSVGNGSAPTLATFYVGPTIVDGGVSYVFELYPSFAPTNDLSKSMYGSYLGLNVYDTNATGNMTGTYIGAYVQALGRNASKTITTLTGLYSVADAISSGPITSMGAVEALLRTDGGAVTSGYSILVDSPIVTGTGSFGTTYGLYINTGHTYGLYVADGQSLIANTHAGWTALTVRGAPSQLTSIPIFSVQDSAGHMLLGTYVKGAGPSAGLQWRYGSQLYEQDAGVGDALSRMIYQPNGDRFDVLNEAGNLFTASFKTGKILFYDGVANVNDSNTPLVINVSNVGIHTTTQFGGGAGVIGIANATTTPTGNPTNGGVLYSEGGALKWRGSNGTVTVLAPA